MLEGGSVDDKFVSSLFERDELDDDEELEEELDDVEETEDEEDVEEDDCDVESFVLSSVFIS